MDEHAARASAFDEALDELLDESEPEYASVEPWLRAVKAALDDAPAGVTLTARDAPHVASIPGAEGAECAFGPPERVALVGSVLLRTCVAPPGSPERPRADVAVALPRTALLEKDYLDYRYHTKRALYLQYLADALAAAGLLKEGVAGAYLEALGGDAHKPALVLAPTKMEEGDADDGASHALPATDFEIRLIPCLPEGAFAAAKLNASRCNLRATRGDVGASASGGVTAGDTTARKAGLAYAAKAPEGAGRATPRYNASIAADAYSPASAARLREAFAADARLGLATRALKLWMRRRGLSGAPAGEGHSVGGAELSAMVAALAASGEMRMGGNSARAALQQVLAACGARGALRLPHALDGDAPAGGATDEAPCVVEDEAGGVRLNLCAGVSGDTLAELEAEAKRALPLLARRTPEAMQALLVGGAPAVGERFDAIVSVDARAACAATGDSVAVALEQPPQREAEARAEAAVRAALGQRARRLRVLGAACRRAPFAAPAAGGAAGRKKKRAAAAAPVARWHAPPLEYVGSAAVGVTLDPAAAGRLVDVGPAQTQAGACRAFRALWGERATLRRFRDGAVCEAAAWDDVAKAHGRQAIVPAAALAVLSRLLPAAECACPSGAPLQPLVEGPDREAQGALRAAFDALARRLRTLPGLPLGVRSVAPLGPALRGTEACVLGPHPLARDESSTGSNAGGKKVRRRKGGGGEEALLERCVEAHDVLLEIEGSGRWPSEPAALAATRGAYVLALCEQLRTAHGIASVPVDDGGGESFLEAFYEGFTFRLRVHDTRPKGDAGASGAWHARERSRDHAHAFAAACDAAPALPGACRMAKRWAAAHLFSRDAFGDEGVELVTLAAFFGANGTVGGSGGQEPPATPLAGFGRFLALLATHDWRAMPLFVAGLASAPEAGGTVVSDDGAGAAVAAVGDAGARQAAEKAKASARGLRMVVASALEPSGCACARLGGRELTRLVATARACLARLEALLTGGLAALGPGEALPGADDARWLQLFRGSCAAFDAVASCHARATAHGAGDSAAADAALGVELSGDACVAASSAALVPLAKSATALSARGPAALLVGFDPLATLASQVASMPGVAAVGWDAYGGRQLAVALKPSASDAGEALAEAIAVVGQGLVKGVRIKQAAREEKPAKKRGAAKRRR